MKIDNRKVFVILNKEEVRPVVSVNNFGSYLMFGTKDQALAYLHSDWVEVEAKKKCIIEAELVFEQELFEEEK